MTEGLEIDEGPDRTHTGADSIDDPIPEEDEEKGGGRKRPEPIPNS
jgi:hypothetical protein